MHSGFQALRSECAMALEAEPTTATLSAAAATDVRRIVSVWRDLLARSGGPYLGGDWSIADAFFAPVCMRLRNYALPVPPAVTDYIRRVCALPGVKAWMDEALEEKDFVVMDEPYRTKR